MGELLPEQQKACESDSKFIRLLAGPGTGKTRTITYRVKYLIEEAKIEPDNILVLTFTRAAAAELRKRIGILLGKAKLLPHVVTLHSFALSQILHNAKIIEKLPKPLRIASDWEERNIIQEDLKKTLSCPIKEIQTKFAFLSADWQTLKADDADWEKRFSDPVFLGAWREHREKFGYTLRSELVYQFKRAVEQTGDFKLAKKFTHILVDEYQDLNRCDLSVIKTLSEKLDASIFVAGDDDQSIYGFRFAHPDGIRRFSIDYIPTEELELETCMRCGEEILKISEFVADLDTKRLRRGKGMKIPPGAPKGNVELLRFDNQYPEAEAIAKICFSLIKGGQVEAGEILILLRSDFHGVMSSPIKDKLELLGLPVHVNIENDNPLEAKTGLLLLAHLKLVHNQFDHLAWRTILQLRNNNVGVETLAKIFKQCLDNGVTFTECLIKIKEEDTGGFSESLKSEINENLRLIEQLDDEFKDAKDNKELLKKILNLSKIYPINIEKEVEYLMKICVETDSGDLPSLLRNLSSSDEEIEQEMEDDKINILTMHKAKGLTATVVIIVGVEDQVIPGRYEGDEIGDERRLLFVSLSRAKEAIFMTYCERRIGPQAFTGRVDKVLHRVITRFLQDAPIKPVSGIKYIKDRGL